MRFELFLFLIIKFAIHLLVFEKILYTAFLGLQYTSAVCVTSLLLNAQGPPNIDVNGRQTFISSFRSILGYSDRSKSKMKCL